MSLKNSVPRSAWPQLWWRAFQVAAVSLFTILGLCLRYTYARNSSPYIDEYTTMWVAKRTVQHGLPVFSTGALYAQGLLFTYLDAAFFYLLGFSEWIARMPSLVLSAAYIPLSYWVGKRILSSRAGILTCALVALDPQSIGWGGRARSYSLLVFLVLLVVYFLYRGVVREDRGAYRRLALLVFLGAVFAHNEAILLYPAILAVALLWRGWRWFLRWDVLVENVVVIGGMGLSFYLYRLMQPAGWSEVGQGRGEITLTVDVVRAWERLKPFFLGPDQLPFVGVLTFLLLAGIGYCLVRCVREGPRGLFNPLDRDAGLFYLSVLFVLVVLEMVFLVSEGRLGTRYLFFLGPVFFLISSAVGFRFLESLGGICERSRIGVPLRARRPILIRSLTMGAVLILVTVCSMPSSLAAARRRELEYDVAFQYVSEHMREHDEVMSFAVSPCVLYLDRCDYVAVQKDFHAYATQEGDYWVEAWAGVPILFTDEALKEAVEEADRMWFVIDQMRFRTRYSREFIQYVWDNMRLVAREDGVFVFLSEPSARSSPEVQGALWVTLGDQARLIGYTLNDDVLGPGDELRLSLRWEGLTHITSSYSVFVHLVGGGGVLWAQSDGPPLEGLLPTTHWVAGEKITDHRSIQMPPDIPPGRYRLDVGMYDAETMAHLAVADEAGSVVGDRTTLDYVRVQEAAPEPSAPGRKVMANLGDVITLLGYDQEATVTQDGEFLGIRLYWTAETDIETDYTVFIHLVDESGKIWAQSDSWAEKGFYPTSYWDLGEVIRDEHDVPIDLATPSGVYYLQVGMYLPATGERLPFKDQTGQVTGDALILGEVQVGE